MAALAGATAGFARAVAWLSRAANLVAQALVLLMVLLFAYEVMLRTVFRESTGFADQLSAYALAAITFLSLAHTLRMGGHVHADLLVSRLGERWRRRFEIATDLLCVVTTAVLLWSAVGTVIRTYDDAERSMIGLWFFPTYLPQLIMPIGLALLTCQGIAGFVHRRPVQRD